MKKIIIIGCGDIGLRVARRFNKPGYMISGLIRNQLQLNNLRIENITPILYDLDSPSKPLPSELCIRDAILYYFAPPDNQGNTDTRFKAFVSAIDMDKLPDRIIYLSTTGVYGNCNGAWVTEEKPVNPTTQRSKRRLDAEQTLINWHQLTHRPVIILRVAGIYGPKRLPIERVKQMVPVLLEDSSPYSNRIHEDDLAQACLNAAFYNGRHQVFNISDGHPTSMTDYIYKIADRLGLARPPAVTYDEAQEKLSETMLSFLTESKRIDNRLMLSELNVKLCYPDLDSGLEQCINHLAIR